MERPDNVIHCEICPIINEPPAVDRAFRIHEGDAWRLTLRRNQALLGTTFITLKQHKESLPELSQAEEEEFSELRQIGGEVFADPEFGQYLWRGRVHNVSLEMGRVIAGRIRENF